MILACRVINASSWLLMLLYQVFDIVIFIIIIIFLQLEQVEMKIVLANYLGKVDLRGM